MVRACIYGWHDGVFGDIHSWFAGDLIRLAHASRNTRKAKRSGMVDLLGMFRRRPAKRGPAGFARSREDITALGDSFGNMLTSPVRDAPPMARAAPIPGLDGLELPHPEPAQAEAPLPAPTPAARPGKPGKPSGKT